MVVPTVAPLKRKREFTNPRVFTDYVNDMHPHIKGYASAPTMPPNIDRNTELCIARSFLPQHVRLPNTDKRFHNGRNSRQGQDPNGPDECDVDLLETTSCLGALSSVRHVAPTTLGS
mmetsp:Transcript_45118/g.119747  ORF Transcript_45118/g.119747 Transcript_45118/m.119747 type:complete len:117 (-) Transcript_45118:3238-3588(-)